MSEKAPWDMPNPVTRLAAERDRLEDAKAQLLVAVVASDRTLWESIATHAASQVARWERVMREVREAQS